MAWFGPGSEMGCDFTSSPLVWGPGLVSDSASKMPCPAGKSADISGDYCQLRTKGRWSRQAIGIFYASLNVKWHETFLMLIFYTTYKFLSNLLCNWHELLTDIFSSTFINRSIDILLEFLTFLSEQQAPFSTMFAWELSTRWYDHSIVTYKFQYSWCVWTLQGVIVTAVCSFCFDIICDVQPVISGKRTRGCKW